MFAVNNDCDCGDLDNLSISESQINAIGNAVIKAGATCAIIYDNSLSPHEPWSFGKDTSLCQDDLEKPQNAVEITYFQDGNGNLYPLDENVTVLIDESLKPNLSIVLIPTNSTCGVFMDGESKPLDFIFPEIPESEGTVPSLSHTISYKNVERLIQAVKSNGHVLEYRVDKNCLCLGVYVESGILGINGREIDGTYIFRDGIIDVAGGNPQSNTAILSLSSLYLSSSTRERVYLPQVLFTSGDVFSITQRALIQVLKDVQTLYPSEQGFQVTDNDGHLTIRLEQNKPKMFKVIGNLLKKLLK